MENTIRFKRLISLSEYSSNFLNDFVSYKFDEEDCFIPGYEAEAAIGFDSEIRTWFSEQKSPTCFVFKMSEKDESIIIRFDLLTFFPVSNDYPASILITCDFDERFIDRDLACQYTEDFVNRTKCTLRKTTTNTGLFEWVPCTNSESSGDHYIYLTKLQLQAVNGPKEFKCYKGCTVNTTELLLNCGRDEDVVKAPAKLPPPPVFVSKTYHKEFLL